MSILHGLNDPHVRLHQLLKRGKVVFIHGIDHLNDLFRLVQAISHRLKKERTDDELKKVLDEWDLFEEKILSPSGIVEYYFEIAANEIDDNVSAFMNQLKMFSANEGNTVDLATLSYKDLMKDKENMFIKLSKALIYDYGNYERAVDCALFIKDYKIYLPNIKKAIEPLATLIQKRQGENFKNLIAINPILFPEI